MKKLLYFLLSFGIFGLIGGISIIFPPSSALAHIFPEIPGGFRAPEPGVPIAGIEFDTAAQIYWRHHKGLRQIEGVQIVLFTNLGLFVKTMTPEGLPSDIEGLPVIPFPADDSAKKHVRSKDSETLHSHTLEELQFPPCASGAYRETPTSRCRWVNPPPKIKRKQMTILPPPPGVIVLKPGNVRETAEACPKRFREKMRKGWRFCIDPAHPQPLPPMMYPPINGIPHEEVIEIHKRNAVDLSRLPGVSGVGFGAHGIKVYTDSPNIVPEEVEGVPIRVLPSLGPGKLL